ncbi:Alpha/Beta hydrolase protein [Dactylonectria macrodidyma]|uniref:Carboxylic ester hydrolase n=1 Tax=Dactylonectria macrodidyma TaxID=307937 RepID=A0A9P9D1V0_9HYPO|nr:Alpha/Beta hydrolase protein [Dactylonectria macrodidyma]
MAKGLTATSSIYSVAINISTTPSMKLITGCRIRVLLASALVLAATPCPLPDHVSPQVHLSNGTYRGTYNQYYHQDHFLGMPYAQPPVDGLRLRVPQPLNVTWTVVRNATDYSSSCIGYGSDTWVLGNHVSEDCLTVNVVRPAGLPEEAKLPVAVWIHGGGWVNGGSSDPRYNLSYIVEQSVKKGMPIIAASMNYRLHAWGFLHSAELAAEGSTNLGYRDQRLALYWIKENIAAFGGDPQRVALWGESAGAFAVGSQLIAYGGRDDKLFRAAILQSGSPLVFGLKPQTAKSWQPYWNELLRTTNCSVAEPVACLRRIPTNKLSAVFNSSFASPPGWGQVVDGDFITASGSASLKKGKFVKVPLLTGTNFDEGTEFAPKGINTTSEFAKYVRSAGVPKAAVRKIENLYPDDPAVGIPATLKGKPKGPLAQLGKQYKRAAAFSGDAFQHASRRLTTEAWAKYHVPVWSYHWNVLVRNVSPARGAGHFQEVVFVFNNVQGKGYETAVSKNPLAGKPDKLIKLADVMSTAWVSFIANGDPNSCAQSLKWPQYREKDQRNLVFNVDITGLAYTELDIFRYKEISYIINNLFS